MLAVRRQLTDEAVQELEEDPEMRKHVALFKNASARLVEQADAANDMDEDGALDEHEIAIPLDELLEDLEDLAVAEDADM